MPMKILITGGAGYLGSVLTPHLLSLGHRVTVLDNLIYGQTPLLDSCTDKNFDFVYGDTRDERVLQPLISKADCILPLAALVGAPSCDRDQVGATTVNRNAITLISRMRSKSQRVLFPTTNSGYGIGQPGIACTEETTLRPISLYATTKVEAEKMLLDSGEAVTYRLATVFGASPRMRLDLLVNDFVYRAVNDRALVLFEAHFKRNYIHIRDVARVFSHGIEKYDCMKGRSYNVGLSDANLSKLELCERIRKYIPEFVFSESKVGEDPDKRNYIVSNARVEASGWKPAHSLDDGIVELIKAYRIVKQRQYGNF
jgi:nucleoside-diphosphate-sugar epimerase